MVAKSSPKEAVHKIVDQMTEDQVLDLLDYLSMLADPDELDPEEQAEIDAIIERMKNGDSVSYEEVLKKYGM